MLCREIMAVYLNGAKLSERNAKPFTGTYSYRWALKWPYSPSEVYKPRNAKYQQQLLKVLLAMVQTGRNITQYRLLKNSSFFWVITRRKLVPNRRFGTTYWHRCWRTAHFHNYAVGERGLQIVNMAALCSSKRRWLFTSRRDATFQTL